MLIAKQKKENRGETSERRASETREKAVSSSPQRGPARSQAIRGVGGVGMESEMAEESPAAAAARARPLEAVAEEGQEVAEQNPVAPVCSTKTMERVAAAKKFIEDHYRAQMKNLQERKERYWNPCPLPNFF